MAQKLAVVGGLFGRRGYTVGLPRRPRERRGRFYAKAQNLARKVRASYDKALGGFDLLLMPTLPVKATPPPPADAPLALYLQRAFEMAGNTAPFNLTGHPAMTVPCGLGEGLPIGAMLIGRHFNEITIYAAAAAFEAAGNSKTF